ncbi:MAG: 1-acyl-sn-glycerol-3-phosphate acyltransferase, partial [Rivularia sp. (in: cyanobacteria)]
ILPICLWGTQEIEQKGSAIPQRVPITVRIGELIPTPTSTTKEDLETVTQQCAIAINNLHDLGR